MSDDPVQTLSNKKQRKSVGEMKKREDAFLKKKKARVGTRRSVINPKQIEWPQVSEESKKELLEEIEIFASNLNVPMKKVPLNVIREVSKDRRSNFRSEWRAKQISETGFDMCRYLSIRSSVALGVNCVSKSLEVGGLSAVIVEKTVNPPILTKMLIPLAVNRGVPIVAIGGLLEKFQKKAGMRCIALGVKGSPSTSSPPRHSSLVSLLSAVRRATMTDSTSSVDKCDNPELMSSSVLSSSINTERPCTTEDTTIKRPSTDSPLYIPPKVRKMTFEIKPKPKGKSNVK